MKNYLFLLLVTFCAAASAQQSYNVSLLAHWNDSTLNRCDDDQIWNDLTGWHDSMKHREYVIAGSCDSIYFFDITDPTKLIKVDVEEGHSRNSINRDYETYSHYVYCVSDRSSPTGSLQIFDLQYLPDSVHKVYDDNTYSVNSHTLFIEAASKRLYLCGNTYSPAGNRSMSVLSVADPEYPVYIGELSTSSACSYTHEVYVQRDTAFCSCGNQGLFIYDMRNAAAPSLITSITTYPYSGYNHSSWPDSSGKYLMFTDEVPNGLPVKIYDISDIHNPKFVSLFNSNTGATPHNAYWKGRFAWASAYEDGVQVWDVNDPAQPKSVGYYDTYPKNAPGSYHGFHGCWGVYPFLPSGNIIASDISEGIFVLGPSTTLGIADAESMAVQASLYPNPVSDATQLRVNASQKSPAQLDIFDMQGKQVMQQQLTLLPGENTFTLEGWNQRAQGLYLVHLHAGSSTWTSKLIRQ